MGARGKLTEGIEYGNRLNIFDTLILCRFYRDLYPWEELEKTIHPATGLTAPVTALREIAANIATLTKTFNLREGFRPEDDRLPRRLHEETLPSVHARSVEEMNLMLTDYYRLRGWDTNGIPSDYNG